jgi:hypothetical protein
MATALAEAQIIAKQRLQRIIVAGVAAAWAGLPHYNQQQVEEFLEKVLPLTAAANRQAVMQTQAFLARSLGSPPASLNADQIVAGIRNGVTPEEVYQRPFVTVWSELGKGTRWEQAVKMGQDRATTVAATDVQLSFTHTLQAAGDADGSIVGYRRVADAGACDLCSAADGQVCSSSDLLPLHDRCSCGVETVTSEASFASDRFSGADGLEVAVQDHGELGPVLTNASQHFTPAPDAPDDT